MVFFLMIIISLSLIWFLTDIIKDYFFHIKNESFIASEFFDKNKIKFFIKKFIFSLIKALTLIFVYIIIYSSLDSGMFVNAVVFYLIIIAIKIVPEFLFLFQRSSIPKRVIFIEICSCLIEYLVVSFILTILMS